MKVYTQTGAKNFPTNGKNMLLSLRHSLTYVYHQFRRKIIASFSRCHHKKIMANNDTALFEAQMSLQHQDEKVLTLYCPI